MKKAASKKPTPQRAAGKTATSISLTEETLNKAKAAAAAEGRPLSNWLEQLIKKSVQLLIGLCLIAKLAHNPMDWSGEACASAVGQGFQWFGSGVAWAWNTGSSILAAL